MTQFSKQKTRREREELRVRDDVGYGTLDPAGVCEAANELADQESESCDD